MNSVKIHWGFISVDAIGGCFAWLLALVLCSCPGCQGDDFVDVNLDNMTLVPGGTFRMGTDSSELSDVLKLTGIKRQEMFSAEMPSHFVSLSAFYLDTTDVTNRDFYAFIQATPEWSKAEADTAHHNGRYLEHWIDGVPPEDLLEHPVTFVTWYAAVAYCDWCDKRLPTEAEWEWVSRGGQLGMKFPWGNELPAKNIVNWSGNGIDRTVPVSSYPPNSFGLYDLSGNVWKFLGDEWHSYHADKPLNQDHLLKSTDLYPRRRRVIRGGSWGAHTANLRSRYRDSHRPWDAREFLGFRCARSMRE
jgi:formylglycine-generating enzyme required for sulfatase activity